MYGHVYVHTYTHAHDKIRCSFQIQILITKTRCHTNNSRGNKVGLLQQITKNKNSHLQWLWSFPYIHKEWTVTEKKRNSVRKRGKLGETILIQWECSDVLYHFHQLFLWLTLILFWLLKTNCQLKWPTANWTKQLQWKPFPMEDVRNLKTLGLAQNDHMQISTLLMFELKNKKKKNFFEAP